MLSLLIKSKGKWNDVAVPNAAFNYVPFTIQQRGRTFRPKPPWNIRTEANITVNKTYYIKPDGSDAADGLSEANALATFNTAFDKADIDRLYVKAGHYNTSNTSAGANNIHRSMEIIGYGGTVDVTSDISHLLGAWSSVDSHYESTVAATGAVYDASSTDYYGGDLRYTLKANIGEVDATPGSYYYAAGTMYMRCFDDREPDSNIHIYYQGTQFLGNADNLVVYMENINLIGMIWCAIYPATVAGGAKGFMKNCQVENGTDGFYFYGCDLSIAQDCIFKNIYVSNIDGLHYDASGVLPNNGIEIDCIAYNIGLTGDTASNGSSLHGSANVVRINGDYYDSWGRCIHDIGTGHTWCLGTKARRVQANHPAAATGLSVGFTSGNGGDSRTTWLDSCTTTGQLNYDLENVGAGALYSRNHAGDKGANSGVITAY
jgi:hypothetical protein